MAARERFVVESLGGFLVAGDKARDENLRREKFRERVETLPCGFRGEVCPVGEQAVEKKTLKESVARSVSTSSLRPKRRIVSWKG